MNKNRRWFLSAGVVGLSTWLAGCSSNNGSQQNSASPKTNSERHKTSTELETSTQPDSETVTVEDFPMSAYESFSLDKISFIYVNHNEFQKHFSDKAATTPGNDFGESDPPAPPMLRYPIGGGIGLYFFAGLVLGTIVGDTSYIFGSNEKGDEELESTVREIIASSPSYVFRGDIKIQEIDRALRTKPENNSYIREYEQVSEIGEYQVYAQVENDKESPLIALSDKEIIFGGTGREHMSQWLERLGSPNFDEPAPFNSVLSTAGHGIVAFGGYNVNQSSLKKQWYQDASNTDKEDRFYKPEVIFKSNAFISSIISGGEEIRANLSAIFENISDDQRDTLKQEYGERAIKHSVQFEDNKVFMSGTYDKSQLPKNPNI